MFAARFAFAVLLAAAALGSGCKKSRPTEAEPTKTDKPDKPDLEQVRKSVMLSQLGEEVEVEGYRIRPPRVFTASEIPDAPPNVRGTAWSGRRREDNSASTLLFMLYTVPEGERLPALEPGFAEFLSGIHKRRTDWKQTLPQRIEIGGFQFMWAAWEGKEATSGRLMRGLMYLAIDGRTVIQLTSQDYEPHDQATLSIAEVAIKMFRKSDEKPVR